MNGRCCNGPGHGHRKQAFGPPALPGILRRLTTTTLVLTAPAVCLDLYGVAAIELPDAPNAAPPSGFVKGVGGTLGPVLLNGELVQGFGFTDNLQQDTTEIPGVDYLPSISVTGTAAQGPASAGLTAEYTGEFPLGAGVPIGNDTETIKAFATILLTRSTSATVRFDYSKDFIETFTPAQFYGNTRDDIWTYTASARLSHQTQNAFFGGTAEHEKYITALSTITGPYRTHSDMDRTEHHVAAHGGFIGQNGHRYYVSAEANRFAYEAVELQTHDSTVLKLGAGWSGTVGQLVMHMDVQGFHKRFRRDLPDVIDVEAEASLQWHARETTTLMARFGRTLEETNLIDSSGIEANQIYLSWRERLTDKLYVQGTYMYSVFTARELDDVTDGWTIYFDAGYAFTPHAYVKLAASHAEQRTDAAGLDFNATRVEVTTHFTF